MLAQDHDPAFEKTGREDFTAAGEILMASGVTFRHFSARLDLEPPLFANLERTWLQHSAPPCASMRSLTH